MKIPASKPYPITGVFGDYDKKMRVFQFTLMKSNILRPPPFPFSTDPDTSSWYRIIVEATNYDDAIMLARDEMDSVIFRTGDEYKNGYLIMECGERSHGRTMAGKDLEA